MTNKEAIESIKKHIEIHHLKEPRAIEITVALLEAIEALERTEWHYPSKGELPTETGNYLVAYECAGALVRSIKFYDTKSKKFDTTLPVIAWMPLPEPPKEEA